MSNINPQNIDGTYPIAGQDNNSQGFRDNFTNTVNNFTFAAAELNDLQTYALLAAPLSSVGKTSTEQNNTINYTLISEPQFKKVVETTKFIGNTTSGTPFEVDWSQGHFQTVGVTGTTTMSFTSTWPTNNLYTRLRLQITSYGTTAITLPAEVSQNVNNIQGVNAGVLTVGAGVYQFEFATSDQGGNVSIVDMWRNYDAPIDFTNLVVSGYTSISGNLLAGLSRFAAINSTPIGNASASTGAFTTLSASGLTTLTGGISGNVVINDPVAGSNSSSLSINGTYQHKYWDQTNVVASSDSITLAPGGDSLKLVQINGNLDIGYNTPIIAGSKVEYTVQNTSSSNVWVRVPNNNTNTGRGNIFVLHDSYTRFVFTAFGSNAAMVTVATDGTA